MGPCRGQEAAWQQDQGQRVWEKGRERRTPRFFSGIISATTAQSDKLSWAQKANSSRHSSMADRSVYSYAEWTATHRLAHPDMRESGGIFGEDLCCRREASPVRGRKALWPGHKARNRTWQDRCFLQTHMLKRGFAGKMHLTLTKSNAE